MQKSSDNNMFANNESLKRWCMDLHNSLGGLRAERSLIISEVDMPKVKALCETFVLQWNSNGMAAMETGKEAE